MLSRPCPAFISPSLPQAVPGAAPPTDEFVPWLSRPDFTGEKLAGKVDLRMLAGMFGVEVCGLVFAIEHSNQDDKERRDDRHDRV